MYKSSGVDPHRKEEIEKEEEGWWGAGQTNLVHCGSVDGTELFAGVCGPVCATHELTYHLSYI